MTVTGSCVPAAAEGLDNRQIVHDFGCEVNRGAMACEPPKKYGYSHMGTSKNLPKIFVSPYF
jgi:hypothetical protein